MAAPSPASLWSDCSALLLSPLPLDDAIHTQADLTPKAPVRKRAQKGAVPRAQQNRISAQRVRDRQRQHEQELATKGDVLERENADLEMQLALVQCGHSQALQELAQLKASLALSASLLLAEAPTDTESSYSDDNSTIGSPVSAHHLDVPSSPDSTTAYNQLHDMDPPDSPHSTIVAAAAQQSPSNTDDTSSDSAQSPSLAGTASASLAGNSSNGEDSSCESAVLADGPSWPHPPQQDVLTFVIYLQLMMRTTLNWASTLALMKALSTSQHSSRRSTSFPSSAATSALSRVGSSCSSSARTSQGDVRQAWQPSLAVT